jgi:histidinol phosphatase-like PHP family hydrolase
MAMAFLPTRRAVLASAAAVAAACRRAPSALAPAEASPRAAGPARTVPEPPRDPKTGFPRVDYHIHLDDVGYSAAGVAEAVRAAGSRGARFGIVEHAGTKEHSYPVLLGRDEDLRRHLDLLADAPLYRGIQAEGLDWMTCFSKEMIARLDYVLTDALTFPEKDGRLVNLWKKEQVTIVDARDFMDRYVDHHVRIVATEPVDILANVLFLPDVLQKDFDALWTEGRMRKVIDAAVKHGVALEIGSRLPSLAFLRLAKDAGARFSFGTNARKPDQMGRLDRALEVASAIGLTPDRIFLPAPAGRKPVEVR